MVDFEKSRLKALQKIQATALNDAMAEQTVRHHDPATLAERSHWWGLVAKIDDKEHALAEWQALPDRLASEREISDRPRIRAALIGPIPLLIPRHSSQPRSMMPNG